MFHKLKFLTKSNIIIFFLIAGTIFSLATFISSPVQSQTSSELLDQINQKKAELEETQKAIKDLVSQLNQAKTELDQASDGLPKLEAEIKEIETQMSLNKKQLELFRQQFELQQKERSEMTHRQNKSVKTLYMQWRSNSFNSYSMFSDRSEYLLTQGLSQNVFGVSNLYLDDLNVNIAKLDKNLVERESVEEVLNQQNEELQTRRAQIQQEISYYTGVLSSGTSEISKLQDQSQIIASQIQHLTVEQKAAAEHEAWILKQEQLKQRVGEDVNITEGFFFTGRGRDAYQGHGVGLSQFGAYGGANAGMSYQSIISFYFQGVNLTQSGGNVNVIGGPQNINVEDYLKHLAEVPDRACGNASQAAQNPNKYVVDNPNTVWDCWPEEAIKAQIVIARTYALFHTNLYPDARSQVVDLDCYGNPSSPACEHDTAWAQAETQGVVVTYGGQLIDAVYSSDNSQGNGTAHNDTIFQNFWGDGTPYPYLRSVNDSGFAYPTQWQSWTYQTQIYNNQTIWDMLNYLANGASTSYNSSIKQNINSVLSELGGVSSISFERDPSQRIKKVHLTGATGVTRSIGGWWFKNMWNTWAYETGRNDYLYSQTFYLNATQ
jgi:SpoIID/LytB domain protein